MDSNIRYHDDPGTADTGVGAFDFLDMGPHEFNGCMPGPCIGELDGDTDVFDFGIWAADFGCGAGP